MADARHLYIESLSGELEALSDQVRNLIGERHWLSDGHHKEALLRAALRRHLPSGVVASRGFVLGRGPQRECSKEQDILIVDCQRDRSVFEYAELIICSSSPLIGAVSVKTAFDKRGFVDSVRSLSDVGGLKDFGTRLPWGGAFFFQPTPSVGSTPQDVADTCAKWLGDEENDLDLSRIEEVCIRVSRNLFCRLYPDRREVQVAGCEGWSTALFIARLADCAAGFRDGRSSLLELVDGEHEAKSLCSATW